VVSVGRRTGRAELDEHAEGVHYSEIDVDFKHSKRKRAEILGEIRAKLSQIPGVVLNIGQPISHRLDHLLSGVRAQIAIKIFGSDLEPLRGLAQQVESVMREVEGVVDLQIEKQVLIPQVKIVLKREEAKKYGIKIGELAELLETAFNGRIVSEVLDGQRTFDVLVRFDEESRNNLEAIRSALIDTPVGAKVPLSSVADVIESKGPNVIGHENVQRRIVVSCNTAERDLGSVIEEIQKKILERVKLPVGYFVTYGGQFESQQQATKTIAFLSLFSLAGMILVVWHHFRSIRIMIQIFVNIPLGYIGAIIGILLTGGTLTIAHLVAFITLMGIIHRNTIMMISHYINLVLHEGEEFGEKMVIRGSLERLVPVLMTALCAGLAMLPLVLAKGEPGKEILYPIAVVILSGVITSTLLDMIVTPTIFFNFGKPAIDRYIEAHKRGEALHF
jgi:Cu/Ag efflux pump CusA